jgi:preprotein translocase subunit SecG
MAIFIGILTFIEVLVCLLLILIVLMQRPRQEGLGASFGDGMMSQIAGAQTTNVLQKFTVYLAVLLFVLTLSLAVLTARQQTAKAGVKVFTEPPPPAAEPAAKEEPKPAAPEAAKKAEAPAAQPDEAPAAKKEAAPAPAAKKEAAPADKAPATAPKAATEAPKSAAPAASEAAPAAAKEAAPKANP